MTHKQFLKRLQSRFTQCGSMRKYAEKMGVSVSYVSHVAKGTKPPSDRILSDMGLSMQRTVTLTFEEAK